MNEESVISHKPILIVFNEEGEATEIPLKSGLILGRQQFPKDKKISRQHCELTIKGNEVRIKDLDSSNKTYINEQAIPSDLEVVLKNNDILKIGEQVIKISIPEQVGEDTQSQGPRYSKDPQIAEHRPEAVTIEFDDITKAGIELDAHVKPGRQNVKINLDDEKKVNIKDLIKKRHQDDQEDD